MAGNASTARWALVFSIGAFCVAAVTSLLVILYMISHDRELAARDLSYARAIERIRTQSESDHEAVPRMAADLAAIKNWMIAVFERGDAHGWDLPELPATGKETE